MTYLRDLFSALDSGWRAGRRQFRVMRTRQRNRAVMPDPLT